MGRVAYNGSDADTSDVDRAFGANIEISTIRSPEQVFLSDMTPRKWLWSANVPPSEQLRQYIDKHQNVEEPSFAEIVESLDTNKLLLVSGPPASGKTLLANRLAEHIKATGRYTSVRICCYNTKKKITDAILLDIEKRFNVSDADNKIVHIIVGQFGRPDVRRRIIGFIEDLQTKFIFDVVFVEMQTTPSICFLLDQFRLQITRDANVIETPRRDIYKYFNSIKDIRADDVRFVLSYFEYPLVLREKKEMFYRY